MPWSNSTFGRLRRLFGLLRLRHHPISLALLVPWRFLLWLSLNTFVLRKCIVLMLWLLSKVTVWDVLVIINRYTVPSVFSEVRFHVVLPRLPPLGTSPLKAVRITYQTSFNTFFSRVFVGREVSHCTFNSLFYRPMELIVFNVLCVEWWIFQAMSTKPVGFVFVGKVKLMFLRMTLTPKE